MVLVRNLKMEPPAGVFACMNLIDLMKVVTVFACMNLIDLMKVVPVMMVLVL